jgi:hypothetical protein
MDGPLLIGEALEVAGHARADKPVDPGDARAIQVTRNITIQPRNPVSEGIRPESLLCSLYRPKHSMHLPPIYLVFITGNGREELKRPLGGLALPKFDFVCLFDPTLFPRIATCGTQGLESRTRAEDNSNSSVESKPKKII